MTSEHEQRILIIESFFINLESQNDTIEVGQAQLSEKVLEHVLSCASVYASRIRSLQGCSLKVFLQYLVRELNFRAVYEDAQEPRELILMQPLEGITDAIDMPFLTLKLNEMM